MKTKDTRRRWIERDGLITHKIGTVTVDENRLFLYDSVEVARLVNLSYQLGRDDEFSDSARRAQKLYDEFGI